MWHHVASRGLLRLRFIYRRLCLSFCGSCLVFLHCHCMLLWSCDRCSYRSRQAMQLKKTKASLPTLLFGTRSFSCSLWPLCFFGRLFAFTAAFASCFWPGPYICLPTTSRMYSFLCQTHHIFAIIDHINSLSHGRSLVNSTRRTRWCSKVRWLSPTAFVFDFPDLPSPCQNSKTSLRMSEDSEVPEVVPECGIKLIYEKTKRPLKRARSLLRFHPEATVLQILRVQDVSGIVASSFEFFDLFNFSFNWFHLLNAFSTIHFGVLGWSHEELLDFWFPRLLCPTSCFSIGFGFLQFVLGH